MNEMLRAAGAAGVGDLPYPGAAILLRFSCCVIDLPARVLEVQDTRVTISAPIHLCRRPETGARFTATWDCKTGVARASGTVESQRPRPPTWVVALDGAIERIDVEQRYPDDSPGVLDIGTARLPARV